MYISYGTILDKLVENDLTNLEQNNGVKNTSESKIDHRGINKGGLVTNTCNLGETEVVEIVDNIYYEGVEINDSSR